MSRRSIGVLVSVAWMCAAACNGSSSTTTPASSASPHACSPFDATSQPITLGHVLGAGRHPDGTIYVLTDGVPDYRAFVSEGSALQRKAVDGSGTTPGPSGATEINVGVSNGSSPFSLQLEMSNGMATRMGVYRGELAAKSFDIGVQGDVLTLVGADVLAPLAVRNLPAVIVAEYDASTADGHRIFVTRPTVDWTYSDFRVFYGTPERMLERRLSDAQRGSTTYITFDLDGVQVTAIFPSVFSAPQDEARLQTPSGRQQLTVLATDAGAPGAGLSFLCL